MYHYCWRLLLELFIANTENTYNVVYGHESPYQRGFAWRPASKKHGKNITNMHMKKICKIYAKICKKYAQYAKKMHNTQKYAKNMQEICKK